MVQGGFADVMPDGLTILAEQCTPMSDVKADTIAEEIAKAETLLAETEGDATLDIAQHIDGLKQLSESL